MSGRWVVLPHVVVREQGDQIYIGNHEAGVGLACTSGVKAALALLATPVSLEVLAEQSGLTVDEARAILAPLIAAVIVVPEEAAAALAFGPTHAAAHPIGQPLAIDRLGDGSAGDFAILGAPSSAGAGMEGLPSHGPSLVRQAFRTFLPPRIFPSPEDAKWGLAPSGVALVQDLELRRQYRPDDLPNVFDVGDVPHESGEGLERYGARLGYVAGRVLDAKMRPLTIGGDHSITRFTVGELLRHRGSAKFGIIHFDAHHDMYRGLPPRPLSHANPFAYLIGEEGVALLFQVGLRAGFEHIAAGAKPVHEPKLSWVSAFECQSRTPEQIFAGLPRDMPYYLSFDIDVMDPVYAPETSSPELGGLSYYQALALVDFAARTFDLIGADVVEVAGSERRLNHAARIAARMVAQILLGRTATSPLETYLIERI